MGSSSLQVIVLFLRHFSLPVLIASLIATPVAWYVMNEWLQNFNERASLHWWIFVVSALLAIMVATITIALQSYKAANSNPVDAIRWE